MFDMSKIKTFKLSDLVGRTLKIDRFSNSEHEITVAFDVKTHDIFVISHSPVPQSKGSGEGHIIREF